MENDTIMIPIPAPPEGWAFEGIRRARHEECCFRDGTWMYMLDEGETTSVYPVAVRVKPKWTPPPEWAALLGHCWATRDVNMEIWIHKARPDYVGGYWKNTARCRIEFFVRPELLPPDDIPADQCCWEIGGDQ